MKESPLEKGTTDMRAWECWSVLTRANLWSPPQCPTSRKTNSFHYCQLTWCLSEVLTHTCTHSHTLRLWPLADVSKERLCTRNHKLPFAAQRTCLWCTILDRTLLSVQKFPLLLCSYWSVLWFHLCLVHQNPLNFSTQECPLRKATLYYTYIPRSSSLGS